MDRASIIVPAVGSQQDLEATLVSVLSHRPPDCEILVVCPPQYVDAYALDDEIRFVRVGGNSSWPAYANAGIRAAKSPVVSVILPGVEVGPGWIEPALACLTKESDVGSVSLAVRGVDQSGTPAEFVGVGYGPWKQRCLMSAAAFQRGSSEARTPVMAPHHWAGVFRHEAVMRVGGWDSQLSIHMADIDLGLRLAAAGYGCQVVENANVISLVGSPLSPTATGYAAGLESARMFRKQAHHSQWPWSLLGFLGYAVIEACVQLPSLATAAYLSGRVLGALDPQSTTHTLELNDPAGPSTGGKLDTTKGMQSIQRWRHPAA